MDTLIQSSGAGGGGGRRPSDHYSGAGEPPYKRPRDELYDRDRVSTGLLWGGEGRGGRAIADNGWEAARRGH